MEVVRNVFFDFGAHMLKKIKDMQKDEHTSLLLTLVGCPEAAPVVLAPELSEPRVSAVNLKL